MGFAGSAGTDALRSVAFGISKPSHDGEVAQNFCWGAWKAMRRETILFVVLIVIGLVIVVMIVFFDVFLLRRKSFAAAFDFAAHFLVD